MNRQDHPLYREFMDRFNTDPFALLEMLTVVENYCQRISNDIREERRQAMHMQSGLPSLEQITSENMAKKTAWIEDRKQVLQHQIEQDREIRYYMDDSNFVDLKKRVSEAKRRFGQGIPFNVQDQADMIELDRIRAKQRELKQPELAKREATDG